MMHVKQALVLAGALAGPIIASPLNNTFHRLTKRADPQFLNFDNNQQDQAKLLHGTNDAFVLAASAQCLRATYPDIWNLYFPPTQQAAAVRVLNKLVPDLNNAITGGDAIAEFRFDNTDWKAGTENDFCAGDVPHKTAEAYTSNLQGQATAFARCHVCAKSLDDSDPEEPLFLSDYPCDAFFDDSDEKYHITDEMNALGATILHEMMHYNALAEAAYNISDPNLGDLTTMDPSQPANFQETALIWDLSDQGAFQARQLIVNAPLQSIKNAENYVWVALETYWTFVCSGDLHAAGQTRFVAPDAEE